MSLLANLAPATQRWYDLNMLKTLLASLIPGGGHYLMGMEGSAMTYFHFYGAGYFFVWPLALFLHLWSIAHAAAECSQRPWMRGK